ncbi:hypothetical protein [Yoonia sp. 208BN28-4]|uniref:hypothetical protein n=1 Tax=Yoonia sp. 208BN28-4 TaxID=3126505 RepID=UPI0030AD169C
MKRTKNNIANGKIEGNGTREEPFNGWGYVALKTIIREFRFSQGQGFRSKVVKALKDAGFSGADSIQDAHLVEKLSQIVRLRVDLKPLRYSYGAGTCFLMVKLNRKGIIHYRAFQKGLSNVPGVIEWDHIPGKNADYLVRVVGKLGDTQMHYISEEISALDNVADVFAPAELTVTKSGVVDNFAPEDFLQFDLSDHPDPPNLHPWKEGVEDQRQPALPNL